MLMLMILGPTFLILYLSFLWNAFSLHSVKRGFFYGVSLTPQQLEDPEIQEVTGTYLKRIKTFFALMAPGIVLVSWPVPYFALTFSAMMLYTGLLMYYPFKWAIRSGEALKAIKASRGWYQKEAIVLRVDLDLAQVKLGAMPGLEWFLLATMAVVAPLILNLGEPALRWILVPSGLLSVVCAYGMNYALKRMRNHVYSEDTQINYQVNYKRKRDWAWLSVGIAMLVALINLSLLLLDQEENNRMAFMAILGGSSVAIVAATFWLERQHLKRIRALKTMNQESQAIYGYAEDERYWYGGIFYNNPNNRKLLVSSPHGTSSTFNMGTRGGKIFFWGTGLLVAVLIIPLWIMVVIDEVRPFSLEVTNEVISLKSTLYRETFKPEAIEAVDLVPSVKLTFKTNGSATSRYAVGYFRSEAYGAVKVFLLGDRKPVIKITLKDQILLVSLATKEETLALYDQFKKLIK